MDTESGDSSHCGDPSYEPPVSPTLHRSQKSKKHSRKRCLANRNNEKAARNDLMKELMEEESEHEDTTQDIISNNSIKKPNKGKEREKN